MTVFTQGTPNWGGIVSEAEGALSREQVTIAAGAQLEPGTIMALRDDGKYDQLDLNSSEGNTGAGGMLCALVDESESDRVGVIIERLAELRSSDLVWPDGITTDQQNAAIAELLVRHIKIRYAATTISIQTT
jgi:hypothetical protein